MAEEKGLKSAFELAMERLRKSDAEAGVERQPLTDAQKAAIAEIRSVYDAKLAQEDVLHQSRLRATLDPAEHEALQQEFRRDRERIAGERDRKIEQVRHGE